MKNAIMYVIGIVGFILAAVLAVFGAGKVRYNEKEMERIEKNVKNSDIRSVIDSLNSNIS